MLFLRTLLMFVFISSLFACVPNKTVYNPILKKNIKTFGNVNFPETVKKAYRNLTNQFKVLGDIKSGPYKGKINFGGSNTSMNEAKLIFYTSSFCRNYVCIITHINDKKLSVEKQKELAKARYGSIKIAKFFDPRSNQLYLSNKSNFDLCNAINQKIPLWGYYEEEAKKRELDCNLQSTSNYDKVDNAKLLEEARKTKELERKLALLEKERNTLKSNDNQKLLEEQKKRKELEKKLAALQSQKKKQIKKSKSHEIGSGFYVSRFRHIVTNQHVVNQCNKITVGDSIRKQIPADLIASDKKNDLAILQSVSLELASAETKPFVQKLRMEIGPIVSGGLMRSEDVNGGEEILVAGFPLGNMVSDTIKVTKGIVSATKGMDNDISQFEIDAVIRKGNSGGPIYDKSGNIVGVAVSRLNVNRTDTINFGIKGSTVKQFLTAHDITTKWSKRNKVINTQDLYKIASKQTVMVVCHR